MRRVVTMVLGGVAMAGVVMAAGAAEAQQVSRQVPRIHAPGAERRRSHLYRLCMQKKGFRP